MTRNEKIRLIKGLLTGSISQDELSPQVTKVWFRQIGFDTFKNATNPAEIISQDVANSFSAKPYNIIVDFVAGKTIL
jgi:hypothetical protein